MLRLLALLAVAASLIQADGAAEVFDIGNIRPVGIYVLQEGEAETIGLGDGTWALVSEFYYGGIKAVNLDNGNVTQIVNSASFGERGTIGLWYEDGMILAASGGAFVGPNNTAAVNVFDAVTGELIVECTPEDGGTFINDVTVLGGLAYATDSFQNSIMVMELESAKAGDCIVFAIETPEEIFLSNETWSANGIVPYANGLLIAHESNGGVYYLDISDDNTVTNVIPPGTLPFADGLCINGDTFYVAQNNVDGPVTGWVLALDSDDSVNAYKLGAINSNEFDSPATCGIFSENVYVTNARFDIGLPAEGEDDLNTFSEMFQVVGVDRFDFSASGGQPSGNTTDTPTSAAAAIWYSVAATFFLMLMNAIIIS